MFFDPASQEFYSVKISNDCIQLSSERFQELLAERRLGKEITLDEDTGEVIAIEKEATVPEESIEILHKQRVMHLNSAYEVAFSKLRNTYPAAESTTWDRQATEAELYQNWLNVGGVEPPTPFIDDLNKARAKHGIVETKAELVTRILKNSNQFRPAIAEITAARHAYEKQLDQALIDNDIGAMRAINWNLLSFLTN